MYQYSVSNKLHIMSISVLLSIVAYGLVVNLSIGYNKWIEVSRLKLLMQNVMMKENLAEFAQNVASHVNLLTKNKNCTFCKKKVFK